MDVLWPKGLPSIAASGLRSALGSVGGGGAASVLVLADNGSGTGLYLVTDDGDGAVAAGEVRLLAIFDGALLTGDDVGSG